MLESIAGMSSSWKAMPSLPKRKSLSPAEESLNFAWSAFPASFCVLSDAKTMTCSPAASVISGKTKVILSARSERP